MQNEIIFVDYKVADNCCNDYSFGEICLKCGKCGRKQFGISNFCASCGAKMERATE